MLWKVFRIFNFIFKKYLKFLLFLIMGFAFVFSDSQYSIWDRIALSFKLDVNNLLWNLISITKSWVFLASTWSLEAPQELPSLISLYNELQMRFGGRISNSVLL